MHREPKGLPPTFLAAVQSAILDQFAGKRALSLSLDELNAAVPRRPLSNAP